MTPSPIYAIMRADMSILSSDHKFILKHSAKLAGLVFVASLGLRILNGLHFPRVFTSNFALLAVAGLIFYIKVWRDGTLTKDQKVKIGVFGIVISIATVSAIWFVLAFLAFSYLASGLP